MSTESERIQPTKKARLSRQVVELYLDEVYLMMVIFQVMAIQGFACKVTEMFFVEGKGHHGQGWAGVSKVAIRKLNMLQAAVALTDLRAPPGNRLEALVGDREGQHSIRINDQWRLVFVWTDQGPDSVQIVDYH